MRQEATAQDEYSIMSEALKLAYKRVSNIESLLRGWLASPPAPMSAEERMSLTESLKEVVASEAELDQPGREFLG